MKTEAEIKTDLANVVSQCQAQFAYDLTAEDLKAHMDERLKGFIAQAVREKFSSWSPDDCLRARAMLIQEIKAKPAPAGQPGKAKR